MKAADIQVGDWVVLGSRQKVMDKGQLHDVKIVPVLAIGRYTEYRGECGWAVREDKHHHTPVRIVVAIPSTTWRSDRNGNTIMQWEPRLKQAAGILMTEREFKKRKKLQDDDRRRHQKARDVVAKERRRLEGVLVGWVSKRLGSTGTANNPRTWSIRFIRGNWQSNRIDSVSITLPIADFLRLLPAAQKDAYTKLVNLKDPTC